MPEGYATPEDVRRALQESVRAFDDAELSEEFVLSAIYGQTEWIREKTDRHWFEPDGIEEDDEGILPSAPLEYADDELDIPSSPHSDNAQLFRSDINGVRSRYPQRYAGPYTRVRTFRRDVSDISSLLIRNQGGDYNDWVTDDSKSEGRGEDYYTHMIDSTGSSYIYLNTRSLPSLSDYGAAVVATYQYGRDTIPNTVRRAVAFRAGAELLRDDESAVGIPDSGQLVQLDTKADAMESKGNELLEIHL